MGEARGDIELPVIRVGEIFADPSAEGGRAETDIDGDIEYLAAEDLDEFALRMRILKMQAPHDVLLRKRDVILDERQFDSCLLVKLMIPCLHKPAASIAESRRLENQNTGYICLRYFHSVFFIHKSKQILTIPVFCQRLGKGDELFVVNQAKMISDFFRAGNHKALPLLNGLDEIRGL